MKVGIYCRISVEKKEDFSIKSQKDYGIEFCNKNGFEYEIFEDIISGTKIKRDGLNKLVDKIESKELNGIWLWNWDRMVRDMSVMVFIRDLVENNNCKVFVDDKERDIINDESDIMDFEFRGMLSSMERRNIRRRMNNGLRRSIEDGRGFSGNIGIGYKKVDKRVIVDEDNRELIVECFEKFLLSSVKGYRDVVKLLKRKYGEELDNRISDKSLSRILNDEKYKGIYKLNHSVIGKYDINIGRIISDELFEKVSLKIKKIKGKRRGNRKKEYLLSGKVVCGSCKNEMWIIGGNSYNYFKCKVNINNSKVNWDDRFGKNLDCDSIKDNKISVIKLDEVIWNSLFNVLSRSESVREKYFKKYNKEEVNKGEFYGKMNYYKMQIDKEENKKFEVLNRLMDGEISVDEKNILIKGIGESIENSKLKYKEVKEEYERVSIGNDIVDYVDRFLGDLEEKYKLNRDIDKRRFIDKFVEEIIIERLGKNDDGREEYNINVKVNLKDEKLLDLVENDNYIVENEKKSVSKEIYNVYISNRKGMAFWRLQALYLFKIDGLCFGNPLAKR